MDPIRERAVTFENDRGAVQAIIREGSEAARDVARETLTDVIEAMHTKQQIPKQGELPFAIVQGEAISAPPEDLYIPPDALEVFLETFEGPLDLLLYLIRRQNLDILDIPIADITAQYMDYVEMMRNINLDLAAEYLVMAAMLAEIKSRILLPRHEEVEDEEDPRAELVKRLQEYERFKQAAADIDELPRTGTREFPYFSRCYSILEALLISADKPLNIDKLLGFFQTEDLVNRNDVKKALGLIKDTFEDRGQPITRAEIEDIRGVAVSSNIVKTLQERDWIRVVGHKEVPGRPALLGTTRQFLDYFNLKTLDEMPSLSEIQDIDKLYPELDLGPLNELEEDETDDNEDENELEDQPMDIFDQDEEEKPELN
ncbi:Segregation and condensation protein A [Nymphon striatum]|nr:Segregation and condensation protein A [Nymphon striatum]